MNPFIVLHHCLPQNKKEQTTLMYQPHLTATSLTLSGQGPGILWTILVVFGVWRRVHGNPILFLVILPVIISVQSKKWLPQLFVYHILPQLQKIKYVGFYSQSPPPLPCTFSCHLPPPFFSAAPCLFLFLLLPLTRNIKEHVMKKHNNALTYPNVIH